MLTVDIYLKSGQTISVTCDSCTFERNKSEDRFVSYKLNGVRNYKQVSLLLDQITAYTVKDQ